MESLDLCITGAAPVHCVGPFSAIAVSSGSNADITLAAATRRLRQITFELGSALRGVDKATPLNFLPLPCTKVPTWTEGGCEVKALVSSPRR